VTVKPAGIRQVALADLTRFPGNARRGNVPEIRKSVARLGQYRAIVVRDTGTGLVILAGNHTADALAAEGHETARCEVIECDDDEARRISLADNRLGELPSPETGERYDGEALAELLSQLDGDYDGTGWDVYDVDNLADALGRDEPGSGGTGGSAPDPGDRPSLADRFLIPPFSVLDARQGWWQDRKRAWISLGIRSEIGRGADANYAHDSLVKIKPGLVTGGTGKGEAQLYGSRHVSDPGYYAKKRKGTLDLDAVPDTGYTSGTSVFDPVLCEVAYRWFSPPGGHVIDPFAGGSVRGIVAAILGRSYAGNDLSAAQVDANAEQADDLAARGILGRDAITWTTGNSAEWVTTLEPGSADLMFTCPPYLWLERYSDDPADLSTMTADAFADAFTRILSGASDALRPDRFAVIVTGDARDKRGKLADLHGLTIECAAKAGLALHTTAVLVTQCGSLPVRAARQFEASRILGATHQDVLVFVKGDRKRAAKACGDVDVHLPEEVTEAWDGE
jgi:hypothetical protein